MGDTREEYNTSQLGHFLEFSFWENALDLLNYQIKQKQKNRHYNTLCMFYYERLGESVDQLRDECYFHRRVANNLFYGLQTEFAVLPYTVPKSALGLRNYKFFTYPMLALYYAIGLYLLKLSQEFVQEYAQKRIHIKSYYGGKLHYEGDKFLLTHHRTYYRPHYVSFKKEITRETEQNRDGKVVIKLDIQNYFDEISIARLLGLLHKFIKPSTQAGMHFSEPSTREQIHSFFQFLSAGRDGIPQSDNNIVSSFIGHLYMIFGDLFLDDEMCKNLDVINKYRIIRYVDDIYVSITFKQCVDKIARETYLRALADRIADTFQRKLGLKFNPKTRLYWLADDGDLADLQASLRRTSPEYPVPDEENDQSPAIKVDAVFSELENLKGLSISKYFRPSDELQVDILQEVLDEPVSQMLNKRENKDRIREIFIGFNFDLVRASPLPITIILLQDKCATQRYKQYLHQKSTLTTSDVNLILVFLCQMKMSDEDLLEQLRNNDYLKPIMEIYEKTVIGCEYPGYYNLPAEQTLRLSIQSNVIEQIQHRVLSERTDQHSVALNHLLNEIHAICQWLDPQTNGDYKANDAVNFLRCNNTSHETCIAVRNLFDHRNINRVSHPATGNSIVRGITKAEYERYRTHVGKCLKHIL